MMERGQTPRGLYFQSRLKPRTTLTIRMSCQRSSFIIFFGCPPKVLMGRHFLESQEKCCRSCGYLNPPGLGCGAGRTAGAS